MSALLSSFERCLQENMKETTSLRKAINTKAWNRFLELGMPTKKLPGYQYLPLMQLTQESFELVSLPSLTKEEVLSYIHPEARHSYLLFLNGRYVPALSDLSGLPNSVVVLPIKDALNSYTSFLQSRLSRILFEETDPMAVVNVALNQMGLFFYVPPKLTIRQPIHALHLITSDKAALLTPRIELFVGEGSEVQWLDEQKSLSDTPFFTNRMLDIALEQSAIFHHTSIIQGSSNSWSFDGLRATLKKGSQLKSFALSTGGKSVRQDYRVALTGEGAACDLRGVACVTDNRQAHIHVHMDHQAPHCESMQLFKNILNGAARTSFEGKIYVHREAQKTQAYQLNKNLLLSDRAMANSKPNLEIFADDVKASHGATFAQIDPYQLFYLTTRGIDPKQAKTLLLSSFYLEMIQGISDEWIYEKMRVMAKEAL